MQYILRTLNKALDEVKGGAPDKAETLIEQAIFDIEHTPIEAKPAQHTPGPWYHSVFSQGTITISAKDGTPIADLANIPEREANARLIAAAPETAAERDKLKALNAELVEALKKAIFSKVSSHTSPYIAAACQNGLGLPENIDWPEWLLEARAVLAKAEGK